MAKTKAAAKKNAGAAKLAAASKPAPVSKSALATPPTPPSRAAIAKSATKQKAKAIAVPVAAVADAVGPSPAGVKKPHRWRAGTVALRQIRQMQKSTNLLLRKLPFQRLVREIQQGLSNNPDLRWQGSAIEALQVVSEDHLIRTLAGAYDVALMAGRVTLQKNDLRLFNRITNRITGEKMPDQIARLDGDPFDDSTATATTSKPKSGVHRGVAAPVAAPVSGDDDDNEANEAGDADPDQESDGEKNDEPKVAD